MSEPGDNRERREAAQAFAAKVGADFPRGVVGHWRSQIIGGRVDPGDTAALADRLREAVRRLLEHMQSGDAGPAREADVHEKYAAVLVAADVPNAVDIAILIETIDIRLDLEFAGPLLTLGPDEASSRLSRLRGWMGRTYIYDVIVTPVLAGFLAQPGDFESKLAHLDKLADETEHGRFDAGDPLQRDLEYQKFSHEYARLRGTNRRLPYVNEPPTALYRKFVELPVLDHEHREEWRLDGRHLKEVGRASYEAAELLRFLRRFRAGTSRPIVVVGNNRYGRQWVVEPLEEFLRDGFTLRYDGVPSHMSTRLSVASARNFEQSADNTGPWTSDAFPMDFVREMDRDMPHIVVADAKSSHKYDGSMMLSRAAKTYANWVAAFNYVRAEGRVAAYRHESCLPPKTTWGGWCTGTSSSGCGGSSRSGSTRVPPTVWGCGRPRPRTRSSWASFASHPVRPCSTRTGRNSSWPTRSCTTMRPCPSTSAAPLPTTSTALRSTSRRRSSSASAPTASSPP